MDKTAVYDGAQPIRGALNLTYKAWLTVKEGIELLIIDPCQVRYLKSQRILETGYDKL